MISGKKVLVTGATGFIGGRLIEKLVLNERAHVRAYVRNFTSAIRIARFDLSMMGGDIADADAVDRAVAGCDVVFHCAHDFKNPQQNLDGARVLAEACLKHGVKRLVHISSMSVYEPLKNGHLDESSPAVPCGWAYPDNKLAVEQIFLRYAHEAGLPVIILQPTIVYGPFSGPWTITPVKRMRNGRIVLPKDGLGLCNAVYVDDVVDSIILAAEEDKAVGERFLISGPAPVTWLEFYTAYERILGTNSVVLMTTTEIEESGAQPGITKNLKLFKKDPQRIIQWGPIHKIYALARGGISKNLRKKAKLVLPSPLIIPDAQRLSLLKAHTEVKIEKARRLLGYEPKFSFDRGMNLTAQFITWSKL